MPTPAELLHANLHDVFDNRDESSRRQNVERFYTEDVMFHEPDGTLVGREAIHQRAGELLAGFPPEFTFAEDTPPYVSDDLAALGWTVGPAGAEPVARGIDILTISDGLISAVRTIVVQ